jgi:hypothetical protein
MNDLFLEFSVLTISGHGWPAKAKLQVMENYYIYFCTSELDLINKKAIGLKTRGKKSVLKTDFEIFS